MELPLRARYVNARLAALVMFAAVSCGAAIVAGTRSLSPALVAAMAATTAAGLALLVFATLETLLLVLLISVPFQGIFAAEVGVFLLPSYLVVLIAVIRLSLLGKSPFTWTPMNGPVAAFIILALVSVPVALLAGPSFPEGVTGIRYDQLRPIIQFVALAGLVVTFFLVAKLASQGEAYGRAVATFVTVASVVAGYALYQQAAYYLELPMPRLFSPHGRGLALFGISDLFRSNATFVEPLNLGHFLIASVSLTMSLLPVRRRLGALGNRLIPMLVLQFLALMATFSAGAYIGFATAALVLLVFAIRRGSPAKVLTSLFVAALVATWLLGRVAAPADSSDVTGELTSRARETIERETLPPSPSNPYVGFRRTDYWRAAISMAADRPLTGVGIGNFGAAAVNHNRFLLANAGSYGVASGMLGEFGIPGLLVLGYFVARFSWIAVTSYRRQWDSMPELIGFAAGFIGMMVQYLASGYTRMDIHLWVFLGLAMAAFRRAAVVRTQPSSMGVVQSDRSRKFVDAAS